MAVNYLPKGYTNVSPYLRVRGAQRLIDFLKKVFDAKEVERMAKPDGTIMHAEVKIGDSHVMLGDCPPEMETATAMLYVYVPDVDKAYKLALGAGAVSTREPENTFYGDRNAGVRDPSGCTWWLAAHVEDISPEEMKRRMQEQMKKEK